MPPLGIAALAAWLGLHAFAVTLYDLNIEFLDDLLSGARLWDELAGAHEILDTMRVLPELDAAGLARLHAAASAVLRGGEGVRSAILAKQQLREALMPLASQRRAASAIAEALKLASLRWTRGAPAPLTWHHLAWDCDDTDPAVLLALFRGERASPFDAFLAARAQTILAGGPDVVGVSVAFETQMAAAFVLAGRLRRLAPRLRLVLGGAWVTAVRAALGQVPELLDCFDAVVPFEGERPLLALLEAWAAGGSPAQVAGTLRRGAAAEAIPRGMPVGDLPTPSFDDLPLPLYLVPGPLLPLSTARGCYWGRCAFCSHYIGQGRAFRGRSVADVLGDLQALERRYGACHFYLVDEALPPQMMAELPAALAGAHLAMHWASEARLDAAMLAADAAALRRSGCHLLIFGLESGSQAAIDRMGKGFDVAAAQQTIRKVAEAGIPVALFLMCGFPGETFDDWCATFDFLERMAPWLAHVSVSAFSLRRGAPVAMAPDRYGLRLAAGGPPRITDRLAYEPVQGGFDERDVAALAAGLTSSPVVAGINRNSPFINRQLALFSAAEAARQEPWPWQSC